jgi:hypothetical protein
VDTQAIFAQTPTRKGMYESFYLRAVSPEQPVGVWIRLTVHKAPGRAPTGSVWCTVFDAERGRPFMHKLTTPELRAPSDGWIAVGESTFGPDGAVGACGEARWSLQFDTDEPELHHLSPEWLYRAPLPRTKLTSPAPAARFDGVVELPGREPIKLSGWPGMVGHNWGSEHAERWIWLHGIDFAGEPGAWLDVALGRLKLAGRMTPWIANGVLSLDGHRHRVGGLAARGTHVREGVDGCELRLSDKRGLDVRALVEVPVQSAAGWRYADPGSDASALSQHDVVNCSVASLELTVSGPDAASPRTLRSEHGCAYELGMRTPGDGGQGEQHGVPIAPFDDG